jgi:DNA-binding GntR family transcriptional regulator
MPKKKENENTAKACDYIRYRILQGVYPAGFRLKTIDLARESGVSRTPVREALLELQQEGLVDIRPRQGARVRSITFPEFKEMCELRLALEALAAELAALNRGPEDLVEMEDAVQQMERLVAELDREPQKDQLVRELAQHDIHFHLAILKASGNSLLRDEVLRFHLFNKMVNINFRRISAGGRPDPNDPAAGGGERRHFVLGCHRKIFDAIVARQPDQARAAMHEHLKEIIDRTMVRMARSERIRIEGKIPPSDVFSATV